jgi:hypothetical protein
MSNTVAAMGVSAGLTATSLSSLTDSTSPGAPPAAPPYKMEPTDTSMYYQGLGEGTEHQGQPTSVFQVRTDAHTN